MPDGSAGDGVEPGDLAEASKAGVGRDHLESVFDAERGEDDIGHQIRAEVEIPDQPSEDLAVPSARCGNPRRRRIEPFLNVVPSLLRG